MNPPCPTCAGPVAGRRSYCSSRCRNRANYLRARADGRHAQWTKDQSAKKSAARSAARGDRQCAYCPSPAAAHAQAVTCGSPACKQEHYRVRNRRIQQRLRDAAAAEGKSYRAQWGRSPGTGNYRRRTAVHAAVEVVDRDVVGERDGWVCGLCRLPIDRSLSYPDVMSASLDHVVALVLGGDHTYANCRIAHYRCNVSKKANPNWIPEVLRGCSEDSDQLGEAREGAVVVDRPGVRASP